MKQFIQTLALVVTLAGGTSALACTITPLGDSQLRVKAIFAALGQMETLEGLTGLPLDRFEIKTHNHENGQDQVRTYEVKNISPMCPEYVAREIPN